MNIVMEYGATTELESYENTSFPNTGSLVETQNKWTQILNMKFIIYCVVLVVGFILNLVVIIVYARKLKKPTYIFLFCLSICDSINCLTVSLDILKNTDVLREHTKRAICIAYPCLVDTGCLISACLVLCVVLDRYLRSKFLKYSLSRAHSFTLVTGIVISSIIVTSPLLLARTAKLMRLNLRERDLMCGELYSPHHLHYSETNEIRFSKPMLFMLVFNAVIISVLSLAAVTLTVLYFKMSAEIRKKSFAMRSKILSTPQNAEQSKYEKDLFREVRFDESSIGSSQISTESCEELTERIQSNLTLKCATVRIENDKQKRGNRDTIMKRKSSIFSTGKLFPSKIITPRYYFLIVSSILLFLFYFIHFLLHIINICLDSAHPNGMQHILFNFLDHTYILCFILNPVIYSFFNRGFFKNFKLIFCCDKRQLYDSRRSSMESSVL